MKNVIVTLCEEMSDTIALVKVMMLAIRNSLLKGGALEWKEKVNIPKPRPYAGEQDVQNLGNFMFDMD